tara:strand:+ start:417 stop:1295 length:879 start_codon:yes stop_codon:yes gene_type:complete
MLICPKCARVLSEEDDRRRVCACGKAATRESHIWRFIDQCDTPFEDHTSEALDSLFSNANRHFWLCHRRDIVTDSVINHLRPGHSFLDVGSGGCDIAVNLRSAGLDVSLADIQIEGLKYGLKLEFQKLYHFDLCRPVFCDHFSAVGAFDVIEHIEDDVTAVSSLLKMTKPGGYVFSTVPAFNQLWSNHDVMERHKRRYSMHQLQKLFLDQGAEIISCRYLFFSIFPLLVARTLLSRLFPRTHFSKEDYKNRFEIPIWLNRSLLSLLKKEKQWFSANGPPLGGSLFMCAKKPG